ncbi:MAG: pyridoxamine 5'-phosphate oxidase family protein [Sporomusaceae bacterium]|nr:pyridoxamine 5'-phosphate oxidase family protein [Sporomusaceae bacterium]
MNEPFKKATATLREQIGQDKPMALATRNGDGVAVRTVNVYSDDSYFYFITEADSNKYRQIRQNPHVALSIDAIQIAGCATPLEHPCSKSNQQLAGFVEKNCRNSSPAMRIILLCGC